VILFQRIAAVAAIILILPHAGIEAKVYQYEFSKIINVEKSLNLTLNNANGDISIVTNLNDELRIDAIKKIESDSKEKADLIAGHVRVSITAADGHFRVIPEFDEISRESTLWEKFFGSSEAPSYGWVDFVISVPVDCNVDILNAGGRVQISGLRGTVAVENSEGDINISKISGDVQAICSIGKLILKDIEGCIQVTARDSDIEFMALVGNLKINCNNGKLSGGNLIGNLELESSSGDIELDPIEGDVKIRSGLGKVIINQSFGAINIVAGEGDITVRTNLSSSRDYSVETIQGSIEFYIPEYSNGRISMKSQSGRLDTHVPIAVESFSETEISGTFGSKGPNIMLRTKVGNILFEEY